MLMVRIGEIRSRRLAPQAASTSLVMASTFHAVQPADNFRNLFEASVLFYALAAIALATNQVPDWLSSGFGCTSGCGSSTASFLHVQQGEPSLYGLRHQLPPAGGPLGRLHGQLLDEECSLTPPSRGQPEA